MLRFSHRRRSVLDLISMGTFRTLTAADVVEVLAGYRPRRLPRATAPSPPAPSTPTSPSRSTAGALFLARQRGQGARRRRARGRHRRAPGGARACPRRRRCRRTDGEPLLHLARVCTCRCFPWVPGRVLARAEVGPPHARQAGAALAAPAPGGRRLPRPPSRPLRARRDRTAASPPSRRRLAIRRWPRRWRSWGRRSTALARQRAPRSCRSGSSTAICSSTMCSYDGGALVALLDFEQASWGRLAYDLAVSVLAFGFGARRLPRRRHPRLHRGLLPAARRRPPRSGSAFADELRFAACRFAVTRITDVYLRRNARRPAGQGLPPLPAAPARHRPPRSTTAAICCACPDRRRSGFHCGQALRTMEMYLRSISLRSLSRST